MPNAPLISIFPISSFLMFNAVPTYGSKKELQECERSLGAISSRDIDLEENRGRFIPSTEELAKGVLVIFLKEFPYSPTFSAYLNAY